MNVAMPLRERVLSAAAVTPSLTRGQARRLAGLLVLLSGAIAAAIFIAVDGPAHFHENASMGAGRLAEGWGLAAAAFACLLLARGGSTVVRMPHLLEAATWASPVVMLMWLARFDGGPVSPGGPFDVPGADSSPWPQRTLASFLAPCAGEPNRNSRGTLGAAAGAT